MNKLGFIGGTGIYDLEGIKIIKEHEVSTPFGKTSGPIVEAEFNGHICYFLARHGKGHKISPSEVNYRANVFALKKIGINAIVSISAVGSLREELPPETFFLPDQYIDWTKSQRNRSFFTDGIVGHVSNADPVHMGLRKVVEESCMEVKINYKKDGSYICIEGPQFSTRAESKFYKNMGASVIGMTNVPEAFLAKEAGIAYTTVAMVTDFDGWKEEHCTVEEIMNVMKQNTITAQKLVPSIVGNFYKSEIKLIAENKFAVVSDQTNLSEVQSEIIKVLVND